jgi:hypothetical protein
MANLGGVAQLSLGDVCNMMGLHRARALAGPVAALMVGLARALCICALKMDQRLLAVTDSKASNEVVAEDPLDRMCAPIFKLGDSVIP